MLTLQKRIDFAGKPWPQPVSSFNFEWLKSIFYPAQRTRRDTVFSAIQDGEARVIKARNAVIVPNFGEVRPNGTIYFSGETQRLQDAAKTVADAQAVDAIRRIRDEIDLKVLNELKDMERAALTAKVLSERVFDKISCLSRCTVTGWSAADQVAFKANFASLIRGVEAIELHRLAQNAIDESSPLSLVKLDVIRTENFGRKRDDRPFLNQTLLDLISVPEYDLAFGTDQGLLRQIINLYSEAGEKWANFLGKIGQVSTARIARGLAKIKLDASGVPPAGSE